MYNERLVLRVATEREWNARFHHPRARLHHDLEQRVSVWGLTAIELGSRLLSFKLNNNPKPQDVWDGLKWNELCSRSPGDKAWECEREPVSGGIKNTDRTSSTESREEGKEGETWFDRVHFWLHLSVFSSRFKVRGWKKLLRRKRTLMMAAPAIAPMHCEQM